MKPGVRKRPIYDIEPNEVERDLVGGWPCARIKRDDDRTMNMSKLLYIKASPRCAQSKSSAVADAYRTALRTRLPDLVTPKPFLKLTEADYDWNVDNILKGSFFVAQAAAKAMKETGGAIVQTGSMWAIQAIGATPSSAYSAAKAGVHALVRNLAIELAPHKIRVTAVAPAVVETPVFNTFLSDQQVKEVLPTFNAFHPLGRNGQPRDVAEAILFLASDDASWITGVVLPVDGGVTAGR